MIFMRIYCTDGTYCDYYPPTKIEDLKYFVERDKQ
jgi:hypothetical protein